MHTEGSLFSSHLFTYASPVDVCDMPSHFSLPAASPPPHPRRPFISRHRAVWLATRQVDPAADGPVLASAAPSLQPQILMFPPAPHFRNIPEVNRKSRTNLTRMHNFRDVILSMIGCDSCRCHWPAFADPHPPYFPRAHKSRSTLIR